MFDFKRILTHKKQALLPCVRARVMRNARKTIDKHLNKTNNRVVQKSRFLNNNRLKTTKNTDSRQNPCFWGDLKPTFG
jgi:hypothetical protein